MRDNSDHLPEILEITETDDHFFCTVLLKSAERSQKFRFGMSRISRDALAKVLQSRPFNVMSGLNYRYFFVPSVAKLSEGKANAAIRIELGQDAKNIDFILTTELVANFLWFFELNDWSTAAHLSVPT